MPNMQSWLGSAGDLAALPFGSTQERAALAWRRINDKPMQIVFRLLSGSDLAAQTLRLEYDEGAMMADSAAGGSPVRRLIIFGIRGHATVADSDIREGYRFAYGNDEYRVVDIILTIGEIQAIAEATG